MEDMLELARELARTLQHDERFIRTQMAQAAADEDEELQSLIGEFNSSGSPWATKPARRTRTRPS